MKRLHGPILIAALISGFVFVTPAPRSGSEGSLSTVGQLTTELFVPSPVLPAQSGAPRPTASERVLPAMTLHSRPRLTAGVPSPEAGAVPHPSLTATRTLPRRPVVTRPPAPAVRAGVGGPQHSITATASWYCSPGRSPCTVGYGPGCLCAAASRRLQWAIGRGWRGTKVIVTSGGASVKVRLIDECGCPDGRVLDLYGYPFSGLAPLSAGIVDVAVEW